jgi:hypothetical protein
MTTNKLLCFVILFSILGVGCGKNASFRQPEVFEKNQESMSEYEEEGVYEVSECDDFEYQGFNFQSVMIRLTSEEADTDWSKELNIEINSEDLMNGLSIDVDANIEYEKVSIFVDLEESILFGNKSILDFNSTSLKGSGLKFNYSSLQNTGSGQINLQITQEDVLNSFKKNPSQCLFFAEFEEL